MGACVTTHQNAHTTTKTQASFEPNNKADTEFVIPSSPANQKTPIVNGDLAVKPQRPSFQSMASFRDLGSKEETFFDSQAWLESDCDDDFKSVNGEFTPSRGTTPVHHNFFAGTTPQANWAATVSPPPTKKKIRLSDLFRESIRVNHDEDSDPTADKTSPEPTPTHDGQTPPSGGGSDPKKEKWAVPAHGCFPRLLSSCGPVTTQQTARRPE